MKPTTATKWATIGRYFVMVSQSGGGWRWFAHEIANTDEKIASGLFKSRSGAQRNAQRLLRVPPKPAPETTTVNAEAPEPNAPTPVPETPALEPQYCSVAWWRYVFQRHTQFTQRELEVHGVRFSGGALIESASQGLVYAGTLGFDRARQVFTLDQAQRGGDMPPNAHLYNADADTYDPNVYPPGKWSILLKSDRWIIVKRSTRTPSIGAEEFWYQGDRFYSLRADPIPADLQSLIGVQVAGEMTREELEAHGWTPTTSIYRPAP